jgi:hypothetical protein
MGWNEQYWEVVSNFYWTPRYLGFKSIPRKKWFIDDQKISIPRELVPPTSERAYFRQVKSNALQHLLEKQEEILNHVFSLVFSIAGIKSYRSFFVSRSRFRTGTIRALAEEPSVPLPVARR